MHPAPISQASTRLKCRPTAWRRRSRRCSPPGQPWTPVCTSRSGTARPPSCASLTQVNSGGHVSLCYAVLGLLPSAWACCPQAEASMMSLTLLFCLAQALCTAPGPLWASAGASSVITLLKRSDFCTAGFVYCSMATAGVSLLERQKRYQEAIDRLHQLLGRPWVARWRGMWRGLLITYMQFAQQMLVMFVTVPATQASSQNCSHTASQAAPAAFRAAATGGRGWPPTWCT